MQIYVLGLIGAGTMGRSIASKLLPPGQQLFVFDVSPDAQQKAKELGSVVCASLRAATEAEYAPVARPNYTACQ
jgi:3-hydroxyisobutyrate dehydrogenase-like beta-hydroxyacid dehydrogenase